MRHAEGLAQFLGFLATGIGLTLVYVVVYMKITPHDEIELIRRNVTAAAVAFAGSLIGFAIPLSAAIANSVRLMDALVWGLVALVVQVAAFFAAQAAMPGLSDRLARDETAAGVWVASTSLAAGLVNASCMTY